MNSLFTALLVGLLLTGILANEPHLDIVEQNRINAAQNQWKATIPTEFAEKSADQLRGMVSVLPPKQTMEVPAQEEDSVPASSPKERFLQSIPTSFDARTQWPSCVGPVRYQQQCGACWAFSTAEVFEDRLCIANQVSPVAQRSPQYLMDCDWKESACNGGNPNNAWAFMVTYGAPKDSCYPYVGAQQACKSTCADGTPLTTKRATSVVTYNTLNQVFADIQTNGPVETWMSVYYDLYYYNSGIYTPTTSNFVGYHAVKIIGWGHDQYAGNYWIVQNSWGTFWGENGFFRIAFGASNIDDITHFVAGTVV